MTRRILLAIVAVAALSVTAFGVPLAVIVRQVEHDDVVSLLQKEVARTAAELPSDLHGKDRVVVPAARDADDVLFSVYDAESNRLAGNGPAHADRVVRTALSGRLAHYNDASQVSVGWPLTNNEKTYGAVRAALPEAGVEDRVRTAWALMAVLGAGVVAAAALLAWRQARRLSRPVDRLAGAVTRLGHQDFTVKVDRSGVPELDRAGEALGATAERLGRLLARERSFSADVSHQLRTPLTGLRLVLETAESGGDTRQVVSSALAEVDRLEATVDDLLRLARADRPTVEPMALDPIVSEVAAVWRGRSAEQHRRLRLDMPNGLPPARLSSEALWQILDVLLSNALHHGAGEITVSAAPTPGGVAVEVCDEGPGIVGTDVKRIFERGTGRGHGIGLALARSLAEAEGSRLTLESAGPSPCFRLLIPAVLT